MKRVSSTLQFRRPSKAVPAALVLALGLASVAVLPAVAQQQPATSIEINSPVLTIDQDRLYAETRMGSETIAALEAEAKTLAAENQKIEADLIREERALTEKRAAVSPEEFRKLADDFDAKVQKIRREQDDKAQALNSRRDDARQTFFNEIGGELKDIVREHGALLLLDRRNVFLSADSIDITDEAIKRVNEGAQTPPTK